MNIMLVCAGGMSTSILVLKMQEACSEMNVTHNIWAIDYGSIKRYLDKTDVILVAPQMANHIDEIKEKVDENVKVYRIEDLSYGLMNGKKILEDTLDNYKRDRGDLSD